MDMFLETERLLLRRATLEDALQLSDLDSDPEVIRFTNLDGDFAPAEVWCDRILPRWLSLYTQTPGYGFWVAVEKVTGEFLGWFHFRRSQAAPDEIELGYRLKKSAWGKGYTTEGAEALVQKGFTEQGARRVTATALAKNRASIRVMEKAGLTFEKAYTHEFTNPKTGQVTGYPAVKYGLDKGEFVPH